jgi:hypothetical protein
VPPDVESPPCSRQSWTASTSAAPDSEGAANDAAKGFEAMAKGLGAMVTGATGDMKQVEPISFRDLQALFPTLDGYEKWNTEQKRGELTAMIDKRFLTSLEGRHLDDIKTLRDVVTKIDLAKLAAMK